MMMATPDVYKMSPNRPTPVRTSTPEEVIINYVSKIPEMRVTFGEWQDDVSEGGGLTFNLKTEEAAVLQNNDVLVAQYQATFAEIVKSIKSELNIHGYKNAVIEEVFVEVTPGMYSSAGNGVAARQAMFTIEGQYKLFSDRGTV